MLVVSNRIVFVPKENELVGLKFGLIREAIATSYFVTGGEESGTEKLKLKVVPLVVLLLKEGDSGAFGGITLIICIGNCWSSSKYRLSRPLVVVV